MKKLKVIIILLLIVSTLTVNVFATPYNATFSVTDQNTGSLIIPDYFDVVTSVNKVTYAPITTYFYVPIEGGYSFGYNVRKSGYASRYSPQYTMPYSAYSYTIGLVPRYTYSSYGYGFPLSYSSTEIKSPFGWRVYNGLDFHQGLDIGKIQGTYIYSISYSNTVTASYHSSMGNYVQATTLDGFRVRYMHMSSYTVSSGSTINKGTHIGYVGSTGNSSGSHLHIDILATTQYIDPEAFFN